MFLSHCDQNAYLEVTFENTCEGGVAMLGGEHLAHLLPANKTMIGPLKECVLIFYPSCCCSCIVGARIVKIYLIFGRRAARDIGGEEGGQWMTRSPENLFLLSLMIML